VRGNPQLGCKHLQHAVEIAENLVVPDTHDAIAERIQVSVAALIGCAVGMLATIDFDDEAPLAADKVNVIGADRLLASEF